MCVSKVFFSEWFVIVIPSDTSDMYVNVWFACANVIMASVCMFYSHSYSTFDGNVFVTVVQLPLMSLPLNGKHHDSMDDYTWKKRQHIQACAHSLSLFLSLPMDKFLFD